MKVHVYGQDGCPRCVQVKERVKALSFFTLVEHNLKAHLDGHENWRTVEDIELAVHCYSTYEDGDIPVPLTRFEAHPETKFYEFAETMSLLGRELDAQAT